MKRTFFITCLVFLSLSAALFVYRLQATTFLFSQLLVQAGAQNIGLKAAALNRHGLVFSHVECSLPGENGIIKLKDVQLQWNRSALKTRQLTRIAVDTLVFHLPEKKNKSPEEKLQPEQRITRIETLLGALPFQELHVENLILHGTSAGILDGKNLSLKVDNRTEELTLLLGFTREDLHVLITAAEPGRWSVTITQPPSLLPLLTTQLEFRNRQLHTDIEADLSRIHALTSLFNQPLPEISGTLTGTLSAELHKKPSAQLSLELKQARLANTRTDAIQLNLHGRMETTKRFLIDDHSRVTLSVLSHGKVSLARARIGLDGLVEHQGNSWLYSMQPGLDTGFTELATAGLRIQSARLNPAMELQLKGKEIELALNPEWELNVEGIQSSAFKTNAINLKPQQRTLLSLQTGKDTKWAMQPAAWEINPVGLTIKDITLTPETVELMTSKLAGQNSNWQARASVACQNLSLQHPLNTLLLREVRANITADQYGLAGTAFCTPGKISGTLESAFKHDLKQGTGQATFNTSEGLFFTDATPLSSLPTIWPIQGDISGGTLQIQGMAQWHREKPARLFLQTTLEEGKGSFKDLPFSGLEIRHDLQLLPILKSRTTGLITINELDTGIPIHQFTTNIDLSPSPHGKIPVIELSNLSASLFGGTITDKYLRIDPQQLEIENTVSLHDIDLSRLITTQSIKGLEISGRIDGSLPFQFGSSGVQVKDGALHSTPEGGVIRYTPPGGNDLSTSSSLTGYALKALEEFHYDQLSATAVYAPDGELQVNLHLEGVSPKLETSRPVHLNINTEQNVLSLLQSLRYSKSLTDEIDKSVQRRYQ